jgi:uncharacterized OsmC-like protein
MVTPAFVRDAQLPEHSTQKGERMSSALADAIRTATDYLKEHPDEARYTDSEAVASLEKGLRVVVRDPTGRTIETDMATGIGGTDTAPSPGWLLRAALASCDATLIAMRAAMLGIELDRVDVAIDSESNDYGILGIDESVPAGPLSVRTRVSITAANADPDTLRDVIDWAVAHCPVCDAVKRPVAVSVEVTAK